MADWENIFNSDFKSVLDPKFEDIQTAFLTGKIKNMYQLVRRSPTKVASLLGLNYDSYHGKLANPEKFTVMHINVMALAFRIDPNIIHNVIQNEIGEKVRTKLHKFDSNF